MNHRPHTQPRSHIGQRRPHSGVPFRATLHKLDPCTPLSHCLVYTTDEAPVNSNYII